MKKTTFKYLGSSPVRVLEGTPPVYLVASFRIDKGEHIYKEKRTWGWFPSLEQARESVKMNDGDMHEITFNYVIIEEVPPGVCVMSKVIDVYKWSPDKKDKSGFEGKWMLCKKHEWTDGVIGWTIG